MSNLKKNFKHFDASKSSKDIVKQDDPAGFEPGTFEFSVQCSTVRAKTVPTQALNIYCIGSGLFELWVLQLIVEALFKLSHPSNKN